MTAQDLHRRDKLCGMSLPFLSARVLTLVGHWMLSESLFGWKLYIQIWTQPATLLLILQVSYLGLYRQNEFSTNRGSIQMSHKIYLSSL